MQIPEYEGNIRRYKLILILGMFGSSAFRLNQTGFELRVSPSTSSERGLLRRFTAQGCCGPRVLVDWSLGFRQGLGPRGSYAFGVTHAVSRSTWV